MKNGKVMMFLLFCLLLAIGMAGCSSSGSGGGGTTPPATPTQKLVGTWNFVSSTDGVTLDRFVFNANGSGSWGSGFHDGRIDNGVFYFTLEGGQDEAFDITWNSDNNITFTNHNGGASYTHSRAS